MALLQGFDTPADQDLRRLWSEGTFVLDTSVLLNLHRYREHAREDILAALQRMRNRLWVPFHVALEYERNRASVIAKQRANVRNARAKVLEIPSAARAALQDTEVFRRHSAINVETLLVGLKDLVEKFCKELDEVHEGAADVHQKDEVRSRLIDLLGDRIGAPPADQQAIGAINDLASKRYARNQPPGYMDQEKDTKANSAFSYGGLAYEAKFGDVYIWEQMKQFAKTLGGKPICFVTDDQKEDWWWIVDSGGKKRLGPRPELKEEMIRETGTTLFHMYGPDAFLESMNRYRDAGINPASVTEAREVSLERARTPIDDASTRISHSDAISAVSTWLHEQFPAEGQLFARSVFPDIVHLSGFQVRAGYEVLVSSDNSLGDVVGIAGSDTVKGFFARSPDADLNLIVVFPSFDSALHGVEQLEALATSIIDSRVRVVVGAYNAAMERFVVLANLRGSQVRRVSALPI